MRSFGDSFLKPPPLRVGDTLALIKPASRIDKAHVDLAAKNLRELGFFVAQYPGRLKSDAFFAASDEDRAAELDWAMSEPGIRAVLGCRGGYGSQRALSHITPAMRKRWTPKIVVGYSDMTYFHSYLQSHLKWISFHGPLVGFLDKKALKGLMKGLEGLEPSAVSDRWSEIKNQGSSKSAKGRLAGGNLSLLLASGPASLPREPILLMIEEVNENFYRIDRDLWALIEAGYSYFVKGIIVGTLKGCGKDDAKAFGMERILGTLRKLSSGPIWTGARLGHGLETDRSLQRIIPLGAFAEMRGDRLRLLEGVVA